MLARLQVALVLVWLLAVAWGLHWALQLHASVLRALGVVALAVTWHALWLALTFALMSWRNRPDAAPKPSREECLRAWWGEVLAAPRVFAWQQPFRSRALPDDLAGASASETDAPKVGVVLVHGFVCNRGLWNPWMKRLRAQGVPYLAVNLEPVFGVIDDYTTVIEEAVQRVTEATGCAPVIVAHSMGGLAVRAWLRRYQADDRVASVVTIGTPHQGTWLAYWGSTPNARQMKPGGVWLTHLAADEPASRARRFVCCFSHCDNIVFPAMTAVLPGARAVLVRAAAHVDMVGRSEVFNEVLVAIKAAQAVAQSTGARQA
ncbi:alpha/beta fold hydrolase [Ideonella paludis]|uniref:Alpha/beta fold hydrolase n=1 Tax=Ideonella paludis TaxID=1233411 RepID=A0ABS5DZS0_9BURK|nr:alpha/beta fold hydrolase [Ideonella paludis]